MPIILQSQDPDLAVLVDGNIYQLQQKPHLCKLDLERQLEQQWQPMDRLSLWEPGHPEAQHREVELFLGQETSDPLEPYSKGKVSGGDNYLNEVPAEVPCHLELIIEREFSPLPQEVYKLTLNFLTNPLSSAKIKRKS